MVSPEFIIQEFNPTYGSIFLLTHNKMCFTLPEKKEGKFGFALILSVQGPQSRKWGSNNGPKTIKIPLKRNLSDGPLFF
jgi:hypothetical protein